MSAANALRPRRKRLRAISIVALIVIVGAFLFLRPRISPKALPAVRTFAITDVTLIDGTGAPARSPVTVVVESGRIKSITPAIANAAPPQGADVINGRGKYLIPGLWDMHVHGSTSPQLRALYDDLLVANGVTAVRKMDTELPAESLSAHEPRWQAENVEPRQFISGRMVNGGGGLNTTNLIVRGPADVSAALDSLARAGSSFVKVYNGLTPPAYFATLAEARRRGVVVAGHLPWAVTAIEAADSGQKSLEHTSGILISCSAREDSIRRELSFAHERGDFEATLPGQRSEFAAVNSYDRARCLALAEHLRSRGTWLVPTLVTQRKQGTHAYLDADDQAFQYMAGWRKIVQERKAWGERRTAEQRKRDGAVFDAGLATIRLMHEQGVQILAGTDMPATLVVPGFSVHDELALLVQAGLTPMQAIQSATSLPARYVGATDSLGTVEPGKVADLVLLDADPLVDITNTRRISAVVMRGSVLERAQLDDLLAEARKFTRARERRQSIARAWCAVTRCGQRAGKPADQ